MNNELEGKVAIITGAAHDIGAATASRFAQAGARVVLTDIQERIGAEIAAGRGPCALFSVRRKKCACVRFRIDPLGKLALRLKDAVYQGD